MNEELVVGIVGPCAAGKSTLVSALRDRGYQAKHIAQEHSYVPAMWQKLTKPNVLIYLDVSYPVSLTRRNLDWTFAEYQTQLNRLIHARQHADLILATDDLSIQDVFEQVITFLSQRE